MLKHTDFCFRDFGPYSKPGLSKGDLKVNMYLLFDSSWSARAATWTSKGVQKGRQKPLKIDPGMHILATMPFKVATRLPQTLPKELLCLIFLRSYEKKVPVLAHPGWILAPGPTCTVAASRAAL